MQAVVRSFWLNLVKREGKMSSLKFDQSFLKMSSKSFAEAPNGTFMQAKHGTVVEADTSVPKPVQNMFRGRSRSHILGSLKSRQGTAYYCIIMWA